MSNNNLKNSLKKAMDKKKATEKFDSKDGYKKNIDDKSNNEKKNIKFDKYLKKFGIFCILIFIAMFIFTETSTVDTSEAAKRALEDKVSTTLSAGTILLEEDQNIGQDDYTITHQSNKNETKIWVWDYAAEDGDYVQIVVNGTPITEPFMIKNKPKELNVPATGEIQIKGIKDGGGGLTYAVRYDLNGTTYFNTAPEGEYNTYTLIRE